MSIQIPVLVGQAVQYFQQGQLPQATALLNQVLGVQPRNFDALHILGVILAMQGKRTEAIELFRTALAINKNHSFLQFNIAKALSEAGRDEDALIHHKWATKLAPNHAEAWLNYGQSLLNLERYQDAVVAFEKATTINPQYASAWSNLGLGYNKLGQSSEALAKYEKALAIDPNLPEALFNKGSLLEDMDEQDAAYACYKRAIELRPDYAEAHTNLAIFHLKRGEYELGWQEFDYRFHIKERAYSPPPSAKPSWDGRPSEKSLLLWGEQGVGDQVLFGSILPELARLPQRKFVALDQRLIPFFSRSMPEFQFIDIAQVSDELAIEEQLPLGSLPKYFRVASDSFAAATHPFLAADPQQTEELRQTISRPGKLICGVSWYSNRKDLGAHKSIRLDQMLTALASNHLHFVNLQYGDTANERLALRHQHGIDIQDVESIDKFNNIDGLAALIQACDLVISTSNTTAHIAGALGKETLLLLPKAVGKLWYWHTKHGCSCWYPSIKLFQQTQAGDWQFALRDIALYINTHKLPALALATGTRI